MLITHCAGICFTVCAQEEGKSINNRGKGIKAEKKNANWLLYTVFYFIKIELLIKDMVFREGTAGYLSCIVPSQILNHIHCICYI